MKILRLFVIINLILVMNAACFADSMPDNMKVSEDGRQLILQAEVDKGFYDDEIIRTIYIDFEESNWNQILTSNYDSKTDLPATITFEDETYSGVGIRYRGQTSYQKVQDSDKKSFNVSIDYTDENQKIMGYKTLNLNNCYEDPSFMREALWEHLAGYNIPTPKVNFVRLVINGENWGIYSNVQQLNGDFFEQWFVSNDGARWRAEAPDTVEKTGGGPDGGGPGGGPGDQGNKFGAGTSSLNYLGDDYLAYTSCYTLKTDDEEEPWVKLMEACRALNTIESDNLYDSLKYFLDVDRSLWHIAHEIIFADEDGYVSKGGMDYYVYYEPETGRIHPIDYDANSTFSEKKINSGIFYRENDTAFALVNKLLANNEIKARYLAHVRTILNELLIPEDINEIIDTYRGLIEEEVNNDSKKIYTMDEFYDDIDNIKEFIENRRSYLENLPALQLSGPEINSVNYYSSAGENISPEPQETVTIKADVSATQGVSSVILYYSNGLTGVFERTAMLDDGNHNDGEAGDGVYAADIPGYKAGEYIRYYIEARGADDYHSSTFDPPGAEHDVYFYLVRAAVSTDSKLAINEVMASNTTVIADPQGEFDDWIEIYNLGEEEIDLSGMYLTDKVDNLAKWQFPDGTTLRAGDYLLVWADEDGEDTPGLHANFKLSAGGELVMLIDTDKNSNTILDSVVFGEQYENVGYARYPNGTGDFTFLDPTPGEKNEDILEVNEDSDNVTLNVYPNPVSDRLTIEYSLSGSYDTVAEIYDLTGRRIKALELSGASGNNAVSLNVNDMENGTYILKFNSNVIRFVVAK